MTVLEIAKEFLEGEVAPHANAMDHDEAVLRQALDGMRERGLLALRRPAEFGGPGLDEMQFRTFQEAVASHSGALAFLQTQHQSAVSMVAKSENEELKREYLPFMHDSKLVGIGFSQLRRGGPPMLRAEKVAAGYLLNGEVPWVTGHLFFPEFLIGASLPDGRAVFGIVPFVDTERGGGRIAFKGPMRLAAMESPRTMIATLANWLMPDELTAFVRPQGWIQSNDMINVTLQAWFALGCARAGIRVMQQANVRKQNEWVRTAIAQLEAELTKCREAASDQSLPEPERLKARAWAIDLAARCAHAGVVVSGGSANSVDHDAQRVYREAIVFSVSAQTVPIMEATLARLVARA